jgi:MFS family permease
MVEQTEALMHDSLAVEDREARRNAFVLATAQAISGAAAPISVSLGGLTGFYLLGADKSLATLPVTAFLVGVAAGAFPAAMLMRKLGRRAGFMIGSTGGMVGGVIGGFSVLFGSFLGLVAGMAIAGLSGSFVQQYRFAAADTGSQALRAKAISWVLAGGIAAAVIGPQAVILTRNLFDPIPFAGGFFAMSVLALTGLLVLSFLGGDARRAPAPQAHAGGRPLAEIARQPRFIVALICAIGAYMMMSLLMTAAPLAMVACGLGQDNAALGIQWHVMAMFAPSFLTGNLIARFGKEVIIGTGMALLAACGVVALAGIELHNFWIALILLGIGWNFSFIGATAMLTETYRPEERGKVQGFNDFLVFGSVAIASFSSGALFATVGWQWITMIVFPAIALCFAALAVSVMGKRRAAAGRSIAGPGAA